MKISVIMPVFNEKNTIEEIIKRIKAVDIPKEIIIVDDSTDETREILKKYQSGDEIKMIFRKKKKNQGKGSAIREGLKYVTGDIVVIQDADLEYDPQDYHELIKPIVDGKAEVVYGSRILGKGRKSYWSFYLGGIIMCCRFSLGG